MSHLIIFGPPGSGKGTQAKKLAQLLKIKHLSVGHVLRQAIEKKHPLAKKLQTIMSKGDLVDDRLVNQVVGEEINKQAAKKFIFDGYPRNLNQAKFLDKIIKPQKLFVLSLLVSQKETIKRLALRQRQDDDQVNVKRRWRTYYKSTKPLLKYYQASQRLKEINGEGSIEQVFNRLKKELSL